MKTNPIFYVTNKRRIQKKEKVYFMNCSISKFLYITYIEKVEARGK